MYNDNDNIIAMYRYILLLYHEDRQRAAWYTVRKRYATTFYFPQMTVSYRFNYFNFQNAT